MNRHQKKVLSLAAAIANLSFSIAVTGVATYAWYTGNVISRINANETTTNITSESSIKLNYDIYKYNYDAKAGTIRAKTDFVLPEYDDYITDKNIYANIILRAEVEFSYTLDTSAQALIIDITKLTNDFKISKTSGGNTYNNVINNKTSNVIQFKSAVYSYTTTSNPSTPTIVTSAIKEANDDYNSDGHNDYKNDDDAVYSSASNFFRDSGTSNSFVTITNNEAIRAYDNKLVVIPNLSGAGTVTNAVIYIECSYKDSLVDKYIESQPAALLDDSYDLDGDISSISFDLGSVYTITYHSNNGVDTTVTEQSVAGTYVLKAANTFSYTGHTFSKWTLNSTSGTQYSAGATYTVSGNTAFYAKWTTNNYTVTYNANGGTVSPTSETIAYGGHPTLPTPTRSNYTFDGWQVNGEGAYITNSYTVTGDVTLKAHWTLAGYKVTFNANGGTGTMSQVSNISGSYTLPSNGFTAPTAPTGSTVRFVGWTVGSNKGTIRSAGSSYTVSSDITLYARWEYTTNLTASNLGMSGSYGTYDLSYGGVNVHTVQCCKQTDIQFKKNNGIIYNTNDLNQITKITITYSYGSGLTLKVGTSSNPSSGTNANSGSSISGTYGYFYVAEKTNNQATKVSNLQIIYVK